LLLASGTGAIVYYNIQRAQRKAEGASAAARRASCGREWRRQNGAATRHFHPAPSPPPSLPATTAAATKVETFGKAALGGPWSLVDASGVPVTSGDLLGRYYLLYFGFTMCPDICPNEMVKMGKALDLYGERGVQREGEAREVEREGARMGTRHVAAAAGGGCCLGAPHSSHHPDALHPAPPLPCGRRREEGGHRAAGHPARICDAGPAPGQLRAGGLVRQGLPPAHDW
jgi:hypothetical protein